MQLNFVNDLLNIDSSLPSVCDEKLLDILLYGTKINQNILMSALKFIKDSHRFDNALSKLLFFLEIFYFLFDDL